MQAHYMCVARGYAFRPAVYQGIYNPLCRQAEAEILPCCRMLGMRRPGRRALLFSTRSDSVICWHA